MQKKSKNPQWRPRALKRTLDNSVNSHSKVLSHRKNPWQDKKMGWIPNAKTERAIFVNKLLPLYYESMFKFCRNSREFVGLFHAEGRWQWDTQSQVTRLEGRISAVLNCNNPAAAGKYFEEDYILTSSDQTVLRSNLSLINNYSPIITETEVNNCFSIILVVKYA